MLRKSLVCAIALSSMSTVFAQGMPNLGDFIAPAVDEKAPTVVKSPDKVKVTQEVKQKDGSKTPVVEAETTQDAINTVVEKKAKREFDQPCAIIKVGSGMGVVCTGVAEYSSFENRNASLLSQRLAYVKAYTIAKKELAAFLNGLSTESVMEMKESFDMYDDDKESLVNIDGSSSETIKQFVQGAIRGYMVYSIKDNAKEKQVTVTIVTTPKTRGETLQMNRGRIAAKDIASGVKKVFAELKTGILPPEGGKVITVPGTKQIYFISFGSEICRYNRNARVMKKLKKRAVNTAKMRAADNMCKLIIGDDVSWTGTTNTKARDSMKQFEEDAKEDPTATGSGDFTVTGFEEDKETFVQRQTDTESFRSASKGKLPPGLIPLTWTDGDWAYCAYVYNPDLSALGKDIAKDMKKGSILKSGNSVKGKGTVGATTYKDKEAAKAHKTTEDNNKKGINSIDSGSIDSDQDL